jgi:hypothetical protein
MIAADLRIDPNLKVPPGVLAAGTPVLTPRQVAFLRLLRERVPASIPLTVTSATRTPEAQARAMITKVQQGDNIRALYGKKVESLLSLPLDTSAWAKRIEDLYASGVRMSDHMGGNALDLRNRDYSSTDQQTVVNAARALGAKVVVESTPPHIHIEDLPTSASDLETAASNPVYWAIGAAAALSLAGIAIGVYAIRKYRRRSGASRG